jgi:aryl-alcohol dehydrogenase-like predicted oxidoreductase
VDDSLRRLNTDYIDLYFAHWPDPETPVAETLDAFHALQQAGKSAPWGPRTSMRSSFQARWRCRVKRPAGLAGAAAGIQSLSSLGF